MSIKLVAENINIWYGDFHAIKNVNLKIQTNEIVALIGPSGCGKSTFLRNINRMNDYIKSFRTEGDIKIDNRSIYDKRIAVEELRGRVGMVFQKPIPFHKSIFENVAYGLNVRGLKDKNYISEKVEISLKQADLWKEVKDKLDKSALSLSGGQQQRLCIARAIAIEPSIILMDEPTSSLDPISTKKIEELMIELREEYTIVVVTHNMQQASRISDKTAFFYLGELIEVDDTSTIFTNPKNETTERYITGRFG